MIPAAPTLISILARAGILLVAFAGYARIFVIASKVKRPTFVVLWIIGISLVFVLVLYLVMARQLLDVAQVLGSDAPLKALATVWGYPVWIIQIGAVLAAGSALFALIVGIGRMIFAMANDGPLSPSFSCFSSVSSLVGPRSAPMLTEILTSVLVLA